MNIYNSFITGLISQQATKQAQEAILEVKPEWITFEPARIAYEGIVALSRQGRMFDPHSIMAAVAMRDGEIEWLEGILSKGTGDQMNVELLAQTIKKMAVTRQAHNLLATISEKDIVESADFVNIIRELSLLTSTLETKRLVSVDASSVADKLESGEPLLPREMTVNQINFGLPGLDHVMRCGAGSLGIIAAITSAGKTTMAVQMAVKTAQRGGRVKIVSLEMDHEEMQAKIYGHLLRVDSFSILTNGRRLKLDPEQREAMGRISTICPGSGQNWGQLEARLRDLHSREGFNCVVVDYFTLLEPPDLKRGANTAQMYGEISKSAKRLAQDLGICVVLVSQFNRNPEECEEPRLKDLRETGQLENDSSWAILMWNTKESANGNPVVKLRVGKNRGGDRWGLHSLEADRKTGNFYELETK